MNLLQRLFGAPRGPAVPHQQTQPAPAASQFATRRELLRVVLRDTLVRHGIPTAWITAEMLPAPGTSGREPGVHLRLSVKHWEPRLLTYAVAFQKSFQKRAELFDPQVSSWLLGMSWQYDLPDETVCPDMPDPALWKTAPPASAAIAPPAVVKTPAALAADAKAELNRLFADGDARSAVHEATQPLNRAGFEKTQPFHALTEPGRL